MRSASGASTFLFGECPCHFGRKHAHTLTHPQNPIRFPRRFNYKGYIKPRAKGGRLQDPLNTEQLLSINFEWRGVEKDASTIFVGTSPEFELALYTMYVSVADR